MWCMRECITQVHKIPIHVLFTPYSYCIRVLKLMLYCALLFDVFDNITFDAYACYVMLLHNLIHSSKKGQFSFLDFL